MKRAVATAMLIAYLAGIGTGMCMRVLGVNAFPVEEFQLETEPEKSPEIETEAEEVETVAETETEAECPQFHYYTVNGAYLSTTLQEYLQRQLRDRGIEWFYQVALCQIYQESRFNSQAIAPNGLDCGLCQFRSTYFDAHARQAGLVEWNIWSPIDQIYVYADLMARYLQATGDVPGALSWYFTGPGCAYNNLYVEQVMQWTATLREVQP